MFLPTFLSAELHEESILRQDERPFECVWTPVEEQRGSSLLQRHNLEQAQEAWAQPWTWPTNPGFPTGDQLQLVPVSIDGQILLKANRKYESV